MANQQDKLLDHSYDGIQEYDNPMPGWWTAVFWLTILFSAGYWIYYHQMGDGHPVQDEYNAEMEEAKVKYAQFAIADLSDEDIARLTGDKAVIETGKAVFAAKCMPCHGDKGQGNIGPNLTDNAWLHGGKPSQIYKTVVSGVPGKSMQAWGRMLKKDELQGVVAFVNAMHNTNVPGKAPEGDVEGAVPAPVPTAATPATL